MKGSFTPMPIPFLEALRGRLTPVFNGTVPLERKKETVTRRPGLACRGAWRHSRHEHKSSTQILKQVFASTQPLSINTECAAFQVCASPTIYQDVGKEQDRK